MKCAVACAFIFAVIGLFAPIVGLYGIAILPALFFIVGLVFEYLRRKLDKLREQVRMQLPKFPTPKATDLPSLKIAGPVKA